MKKLISFLLAISVVSIIAATGAIAQDENPNASAKTTAECGDINLVETASYSTIITNDIKMSNQKDLIIDVALQCGLYTKTTAKSKGGVKDTEWADAVITVRVLVDGEEASPGPVVFSRRYQELSATLQGIINDIVCVYEGPGPDGIVGTDDDVITCTIDEETLTEEEIELILLTMDAHSFIFLVDDLPSGVHTIEVQAQIDTSSSSYDAEATALVGKGSMSVQEVRFIKDDNIVME